MDRRKIADAMRNGIMPRAHLRSCNPNALWMDTQVDPSTPISRSRKRSLLARVSTRSTSGEFMIWSGVMPAMTTPFDNDLKVDHPFLSQHAAWLLGNGCTGLVMLGSLGEGATLEANEKIDILKTAVGVSAGKK